MHTLSKLPVARATVLAWGARRMRLESGSQSSVVGKALEWRGFDYRTSVPWSLRLVIAVLSSPSLNATSADDTAVCVLTRVTAAVNTCAYPHTMAPHPQHVTQEKRQVFQEVRNGRAGQVSSLAARGPCRGLPLYSPTELFGARSPSLCHAAWFHVPPTHSGTVVPST